MEAHRIMTRRGSHIFLEIRLTDGGEVVSLTRRPHFTSEIFLGFISVRD
jgi:hypothetical protein